MLQHVIDRIREEGAIPFEVFMELALYHPDGGYFMGERLRSVQGGDFLTSPEVSPLFGETLAELVMREAAEAGLSRPMVVDAGAGSGSLLRPLLAVLGERADPWAVEVSPPARRALAELVGTQRVVESLEGLPQGIAGVIFANELLDNLPMALARRRAGLWRELWVDESGDRLGWAETPARPEVEEWLGRFAGPTPEGGMVECQLAAVRWVGAALDRLAAGALVVFDYGDTAQGLEGRRPEGTLRTYRAHHLGPDPLSEPGRTDITADLNFTAVAEAARATGATVSLHRQDDLLEELGLAERIGGLRAQEAELARSGDELRRLEIRSLRIGAETLLHPRGLGDFRVLIARRKI
ncbi:MAG: SAM-dependent methyltransferase [bacterium]|nr:SAM-dependent methyltransferase [bacterium]